MPLPLCIFNHRSFRTRYLLVILLLGMNVLLQGQDVNNSFGMSGGALNLTHPLVLMQKASFRQVHL